MPAAKNSTQAPWNGRFVWHDLMTKDAKKAADFYCALLGWQIQEMDMMGSTYRMIVAGPGPIGGIVEEQNIPVAHWMPYLATPDVDKSAARCKELGGSVCVGPMDIPSTGRFAVVGDPTGGYFSLYKGLPESQGFDPDLPVPGRVCWNELLTTNDAAAQTFYSAMFGWTRASKDMGPAGQYHVQMLGDKQAAGLMKHPQPGAPSAWLVYFLVTNLKQATDKAKTLQATPLMENVPIPDVGAFSMFVDPTGAAFALFEALPMDANKQASAKTTRPNKAAPTKANGKSAKKATVLKAQPKTKTMASRPPKKPAKPVKKLVAKAAPKKATAAKKPAPKKAVAKKPGKAKAKVLAKSKR